MAGKIKRSESNKQYFNAYNPEKQREKRLQRHLKKHPNDAQASSAKPTVRRKKPLNKGGWLTREMSARVYLGFAPGKNDDAVSIMNSLTRSDQKEMAKWFSKLRGIRNMLAYQKPENDINNQF